MKNACIFLTMILMSLSCRKSDKIVTTASPQQTGTTRFSSSPVDTSFVEYIIPLGNTRPPDHTLPTDHIYFVFYYTDILKKHPVYAPAAGYVKSINSFGNDQTIEISVSSTLIYYLGHIYVNSGLTVGDYVSAGQQIGESSGLAAALDLGVMNTMQENSFANTARYSEKSLYCDAPLRYYEEPLQGKLYQKVKRQGPEKDGKINYDVAGTLSGNWFLQGLPEQESMMPSAWSKHLSFCYDKEFPSQQRISIGGQLTITGLYGTFPGVFDPSQITPSSGEKTYRLYNFDMYTGQVTGSQIGLIHVNLVDNNTLKIETFTNSIDTIAEFTGNALIYKR